MLSILQKYLTNLWGCSSVTVLYEKRFQSFKLKALYQMYFHFGDSRRCACIYIKLMTIQRLCIPRDCVCGYGQQVQGRCFVLVSRSQLEELRYVYVAYLQGEHSILEVSQRRRCLESNMKLEVFR